MNSKLLILLIIVPFLSACTCPVCPSCENQTAKEVTINCSLPATVGEQCVIYNYDSVSLGNNTYELSYYGANQSIDEENRCHALLIVTSERDDFKNSNHSLTK